MPSDRRANVDHALRRGRRVLAGRDDLPDSEVHELVGELLEWVEELTRDGALDDALECSGLAAALVRGERSAYEIDALRHEATLAARSGRPERARQALDALASLDRPLHASLTAELAPLLVPPAPVEAPSGAVYVHPKLGRLVEVERLGDKVRVRGEDGVERVILRRFLTAAP
jgi:hypothetical protein